MDKTIASTEYRVWYCPNFPGEVIHFYVSSPKEGADKINEQSKKDLHNKNIYQNAFGLEVFEDGEWCEWYDENGDDIDTLADSRW
jgi:hypothetical protein